MQHIFGKRIDPTEHKIRTHVKHYLFEWKYRPVDYIGGLASLSNKLFVCLNFIHHSMRCLERQGKATQHNRKTKQHNTTIIFQRKIGCLGWNLYILCMCMYCITKTFATKNISWIFGYRESFFCEIALLRPLHLILRPFANLFSYTVCTLYVQVGVTPPPSTAGVITPSNALLPAAKVEILSMMKTVIDKCSQPVRCSTCIG